MNKVEFDVSVNIKAYWSSKAMKFTAVHEYGHISDMIGYVIMEGISILRKLEKKEFTNQQINLMNKKINDAIVDFGDGFIIAQMQSVAMKDSFWNPFWAGINWIVDVGKMIIMKMPKTDVETFNIKF